MIARTIAVIAVFVVIYGGSIAQESCDQVALGSTDKARAEHSVDVNALFSEIDNIRTEWESCASSESVAAADEETAQMEMSASEIVDGGHIVEGLWEFSAEYTLSDACSERRKRVTYDFYEDVYYNDAGLLIWDAGNKYSNFTFEYLLAQRYTRSEDSGNNWVDEYEITSTTETTMSGRYSGYWQGNKDVWCSRNGTFTAELFDIENACLVEGEANIRTNPSTRSPANGVIDDQRRVIAKVSGDDGYYWWQLADDEYVREDVVTASRSCERL